MRKLDAMAIPDLSAEETQALLDRVRDRVAPEDFALIEAFARGLTTLVGVLENKEISLGRLRRMLFGAATEKTDRVLGDADEADDAPKRPPGKRKGHGRNGADAYPGAERIAVPHPDLSSGCDCPTCGRGKVYADRPRRATRVLGTPLFQGRVYEQACWRCGLCGESFTAALPPEAGDKKYDATAYSLLALLKYGAGMPFYRLEQLQKSLGVPLPSATQWKMVAGFEQIVQPVGAALVDRGAQGTVVHNDDTGMTILEAGGSGKDEPGATAETPGRERTGVFTSGIVSQTGEHTIALYFTDNRHAGECLSDVLAKRASDAELPIQMCDALSRNVPSEFATILANCLAHARRRFVDIHANFPEACRFVLECLRAIYRNDAIAKQRGLSPEARLAWHRAESGPIMERLRAWMEAQLVEKRVEPNSALGKAIAYMRNHWEPLTLFLRQAGAPLDNNLCERILKRAILHRKNALFYKTRNGARVGDLFMSLIETCRLNGANPFDYLTELYRNAERVAERPAEWLPWNYREALQRGSANPRRSKPG